MGLRITNHAKMRMKKYGISESSLRKGMENPDSVVDGHSGRRIAQRKFNNHVLRIIFEKRKDKNVIVTVYKARRERYEI
ncbi:hypothetical protein AKJ66_02755 [candidate division MSBL1 archaeon SCGC-AAA259E22]|uniref:DUF4258 domain-containing protein n=2 Tax=candidate division MSBL1 TaxID=215777 RepID=A0A133U3K4_9EURY|nr:hypothetical protein AKJ61_04190 [candidate division MSBL1 archaeon SCGC-AAA259B11]KXA93093.1 hypothetical protein AKJ66_02755 [candidate division MSBL1 archaeon SCGC-AAA259E22]